MIFVQSTVRTVIIIINMWTRTVSSQEFVVPNYKGSLYLKLVKAYFA